MFLQDDWRVGSKLTLNLGLRWEFESPMVEAENRTARGFDADVSQAFEAQARAAYAASQATNPTPEVPASQFNVRGGLTFPGVNGEPEGLYETPKGNIMPRMGFAYKLNDRTVVRGGYGLYYGFLGQRRGDVFQIGYSQSTPMTVSTNNGLSFIETLSNPFQGGILEPRGSADGIATFLGQGITYFDPNPKSPKNQRWQVGLQRELGGVWVGEVRYVGNYGLELETGRNINALPNEFLSTSSVRDQARNDYLTAQVPNPFVGLMPASAPAGFRGATIGRQQLMRPYPHFGDINTTTNEGQSWYSAMQVNLERRLSRGYTFNVAYTWSRFEEALSFLNADDAEPTRMISDMDAPHRLAISGIWELPFGQGRRFASNASPVLDKFIGGWQIQAFTSTRRARRSAISATTSWWDRRTTLRCLAASGRSSAGSMSARSIPNSAQQLVSNVRTFPMRFDDVRVHDTNNVDLSLIKNTTIAKGANMQLRLEALNAFNHVLFPGPGVGTVTATAFGQVVTSTQANYSRRVQAMVKFLF